MQTEKLFSIDLSKEQNKTKSKRGTGARTFKFIADPIFIRKLKDAGLSCEQVGAKIGRTGSCISTYLSGGEKTLLTAELAAECVWNKEFAPKEKRTFAVISGKPEHLAEIEKVLVAAGGSFSIAKY